MALGVPSSLIVLTDSQVQSLCENMAPGELDLFVNGLAAALHDYSTNAQAARSGAYDQPARISTRQPLTQSETLYMPSSSPGGVGLKVLTNSPLAPGTGSVTLMTPTGEPLGFLHARAFTGFRTALASMCLVARRVRVRRLVVFGAGIQAYWHVRLALKLRGDMVEKVHVIARSYSEGARGLIRALVQTPAEVRRAEGWAETRFSLVTPAYVEYARLLVHHVQKADVIFCCTPSTEPLFPAEALTSKEAPQHGRLIVAVGSYRPDMRELPDELIQKAVKHRPPRRFHRRSRWGGVIVVDTVDGALQEAGELIHGNVDPRRLVELGELVMLHRLEEGGGEGEGFDLARAASQDDYDDDVAVETPASPGTPWAPTRPSLDMGITVHSNGGDGGGGGVDGAVAGADSRPGTPGSPSRSRVSRLVSGFRDRVSRRSRGSISSIDLSQQQQQQQHADDGEEGRGANPRPSAAPFLLPRDSSTAAPHARKASASESTTGTTTGGGHGGSESDSAMSYWLKHGDVIYKSVGFGLMDLVVGMQVIKAAADTGAGHQVPGFSGPARYEPEAGPEQDAVLEGGEGREAA
jgi:ornithine cyclodeaminase/alanine dehydrogenase-like protein (mu-crystallin family)